MGAAKWLSAECTYYSFKLTFIRQMLNTAMRLMMMVSVVLFLYLFVVVHSNKDLTAPI